MSRRRRFRIPTAAEADDEQGSKDDEQAEWPGAGGQGTGSASGGEVVGSRSNRRPRVKISDAAATSVLCTSTSSSGSKQHERPVL